MPLPFRCDSLVFDLDGTLWNASVPTAEAWNHILATEGIASPVVTPELVQSVTGLPHDVAIRRAFPDVSAAEQEILIRRTEVGDGEFISRLGAPLYPGVAEGVQSLACRLPLFIVSNCQKGYIETFLGQSGLGDCFRDFECVGNTGLHKPSNLRLLIDRNGLANPAMVGDTSGDEEAARFCEIPFIFVSYGFGLAISPDEAFGSFGELVKEL